jgi:hypothetical protein
MALSGLAKETFYSEISYTSESKTSFTISQKEHGPYFSIRNLTKEQFTKFSPALQFVPYSLLCFKESMHDKK